jgi:general secretion pathway protein F
MNAPAGGKTIAPALADFIAISEEIASLARARLPLESHLARVGADLPGNAGVLAERIGRRLESGESLSDAMDVECVSLPAAYRAVIVAGVESGNLGAAIESLVDTSTRLEQMRRVTGLALLYPLMVVILASTLFAFLLTRIIPQFEWMYEPHFGVISRLAAIPGIGRVFSTFLPLGLVLLVAIWWARSGRVTESRTAFGWLPGFRRVQKWSEAAKFAELLRLLIGHDLPLDRALALAGDAVDDGRIRTAARELAGRVERGEIAMPRAHESVHTELSRLPRLLRLALYHATDRQLMSASLEQAAALYRGRAIRAAEWYAEYLPILLTLGIAGTVTIAFTLVVFWPYASLLHGLARWDWR